MKSTAARPVPAPMAIDKIKSSNPTGGENLSIYLLRAVCFGVMGYVCWKTRCCLLDTGINKIISQNPVLYTCLANIAMRICYLATESAFSGQVLLSAFRAFWRRIMSSITSAAIDSTIGTARGTTQGSCRPLACRVTWSPA